MVRGKEQFSLHQRQTMVLLKCDGTLLTAETFRHRWKLAGAGGAIVHRLPHMQLRETAKPAPSRESLDSITDFTRG